MFFIPNTERVTDGLNIDPMLALMALQADTPEELDEVLTEIERNDDMARTARDYIKQRTK